MMKKTVSELMGVFSYLNGGGKFMDNSILQMEARQG